MINASEGEYAWTSRFNINFTSEIYLTPISDKVFISDRMAGLLEYKISSEPGGPGTPWTMLQGSRILTCFCSIS